MATLPIALQLYTVREDLASDFRGTMRKVAEMGYKAIEFAGYGGMTAADLKSFVGELGLQPVATHISLDVLEQDPSAAMAYAAEVGCTHAGCPYLPENRRGDAAGYRALAGILSRAGAKAKEYGLSFFYHNHAFEFEKLDGRYALDILYEAADPQLVKAEFDVYWAQYGGVDPAAYIRKLGRRCTLLHMKDMAPGPDRHFAEIGEGILDIDAIVQAGQEVGAQWYIVEQDRAYDRTPLEAARLSLQNMKARGWA
jgi:sugar phosphate isomerase/epimerase